MASRLTENGCTQAIKLIASSTPCNISSASIMHYDPALSRFSRQIESPGAVLRHIKSIRTVYETELEVEVGPDYDPDTDTTKLDLPPKVREMVEWFPRCTKYLTQMEANFAASGSSTLNTFDRSRLDAAYKVLYSLCTTHAKSNSMSTIKSYILFSIHNERSIKEENKPDPSSTNMDEFMEDYQTRVNILNSIFTLQILAIVRSNDPSETNGGIDGPVQLSMICDAFDELSADEVADLSGNMKIIREVVYMLRDVQACVTAGSLVQIKHNIPLLNAKKSPLAAPLQKIANVIDAVVRDFHLKEFVDDGENPLQKREFTNPTTAVSG